MLLSLSLKRVHFKWLVIHEEVSKEGLVQYLALGIQSIFNGVKWKEYLLIYTAMNGELEIFAMIWLKICGTELLEELSIL